MKLILMLLLIPTIALAKSFTGDNQTTTYDCASDPNVSIAGNGGTYTLTGACNKITINGNNDTVNVDTGDRIVINGNTDTVNAGKLGALSVNGNDNTFTAKTRVVHVSDAGNRNKIDAGPHSK